jgi:hypothetical protein
VPGSGRYRSRFCNESPTGYNVQRWSEIASGGHFAAMEEPDLFIKDIRAFLARCDLLDKNRVSDKKYCCETMRYQLNLQCDQHPGTLDCADILVCHSEQSDEYGIIIHDGGSSYSVIQYCPWCGTKLP